MLDVPEELRDRDELFEELDEELSRDLVIFRPRLKLRCRVPLSSRPVVIFLADTELSSSLFVLFCPCLVSFFPASEESDPELRRGRVSVGGNVGPNISLDTLSDIFCFLSGLTRLSSYERLVANLELPTNWDSFVALVSAGTQVASSGDERRRLCREELDKPEDDEARRL